jgi:hypothetical protein
VLLKLLYLGRRLRHPARPQLYGEHLAFAAHNHAFLFVAGTFLVLLPPTFPRQWIGWSMLVYLIASTRAVYRGSWLGIAARGLAFLVAYSILFGLVTAGLLVAAVLLR